MIREDREAEELHVAGVKTEAPSAADEEKPGRRDPWRPRDGETAESLLEGADAAVGMITADADENMVLLADGSEMLLDRYQVAAAASNGDSQPASPAPMLFGKAEAQAWICNDCIDLATAFKEHQTAKKAAADDVMDHDHEPVRPTASPVFCHVNCARVNFKRHQESVHGYRAPGRDEAERQGPGCPIVYTGASDMYEPRDPLHHVTFLGDALARMAERATERGVEGEATVAVDAPDAAAAEEVKEPKREPA